MMKTFILNLNEYHPALYVMFMFLGWLMVISILLSVTFSILIRIMTVKDKDEIFTFFIKESPKKYHNLLNMKIGGWLMNMEIPFFYWRMFKIHKMNKNDLMEWRTVVKKAFGKRYVFFKIRMLSNRLLLMTGIPAILIAFIFG
ncbi:TPA: hypothetical protein ACX6RJ_002037 [Photobacterium damselae]